MFGDSNQHFHIAAWLTHFAENAARLYLVLIVYISRTVLISFIHNKKANFMYIHFSCKYLFSVYVSMMSFVCW